MSVLFSWTWVTQAGFLSLDLSKLSSQAGVLWVWGCSGGHASKWSPLLPKVPGLLWIKPLLRHADGPFSGKPRLMPPKDSGAACQEDLSDLHPPELLVVWSQVKPVCLESPTYWPSILLAKRFCRAWALAERGGRRRIGGKRGRGKETQALRSFFCPVPFSFTIRNMNLSKAPSLFSRLGMGKYSHLVAVSHNSSLTPCCYHS